MLQKATGGHDTSHVDKLRFSMQTRTSGSSEWLLPTAVVYHIIDCVRISQNIPKRAEIKTMGKSQVPPTSLPPPPRGGLCPRHETWADTAALGPLVTLAPAGEGELSSESGRHGSILSLAPQCPHPTARGGWLLELKTKLREDRSFTDIEGHSPG